MNPIINFDSQNNIQNDDKFSFGISNTNVSFVNALRRTILSDIPLLVFKTYPHAESKCNVHVNTTRLNNEILKQRLSCIPIHMNSVLTFDNYKDYYLEVNVENTSETKMLVTTENFRIINKNDGSELPKDTMLEIFPSSGLTGHFIEFARLRPSVRDSIKGDHLHLTSDFMISNAKDNSMFNVVSNCSFGFSVDTDKQASLLEKLQETWKTEGKTEDEVRHETMNWKLLDGKRVVKQDSFLFLVQTIGVYTNIQLLTIACDVIINKLNEFNSEITNQTISITPSITTMNNAFDIVLQNEDYTLGKIIELSFYEKYYNPGIATFCGFQKKHPHDDFSIIRVAYENTVDISVIHGHLQECVKTCKEIYEKIKNAFNEL